MKDKSIEEKVKELLRKWWVKGQLLGNERAEALLNRELKDLPNIETLEAEMNKDVAPIADLYTQGKKDAVKELKQEIEDVASQYEHEVHGSDGITGFDTAINHSLNAIDSYAKTLTTSKE